MNCTDCTRRSFMAGTAATAAGVGVLLGPGWATPLANAVAGIGGGRTSPGQLVVVFLRGGMDALSAVVPAADPMYYDMRPTIAVPEAALLDADGFFGFHPALAPLHELYADGRLAVVHAAGNPAGSRSHFDAQDLAEQGDDERRSDGSGWLARHLQTVGDPDQLFRAVGFANNNAGSLRGSSALSIPSLAQFALGGRSGLTRNFGGSLRQAYFGDLPAEKQGTATLDAVDAAAGLGGAANPQDPYTPYADAATLLASDLGVEVVTINEEGWDLHDAMGTYESGAMQQLFDALARNLSRFQEDLDARGLNRVTTVVMTEFGRCVDENGSGGTDHGFGGAMLVMGSVVGGRVLGEWPGLEQHHEHEDLMVTTDFRDVLWELVRDVLGNPSPGAVFAGHNHTPVGLMG